ncbi:hypothetical protein GSI_03356 [Ganoderma sinense ZZ0214-1]|uniref:F-box domain-containing protein n=1 Tax=Ganoderma sinense ZZ0214-1 TaxID=1077348 RepID=A0A2G8SLD5_9APHY|nr:hypothetical protein GSI_03356 [Ganoderma sinense ZZ0214-1]
MSLSRSPGSLYGTTTHRVLAIPEIVELVFSFLDDAERANNARVSKGWSEVALDLLWRSVDDLPRLFGLLAQLDRHEDGTRFHRPLEPNDWTRFMHYASRVRTLSVEPGVDRVLRGPFVFDEVARSRTALNILPKLTSFTWLSQQGDRLRMSLMFMHDSIKEFAVTLVPSPGYSLGTFFQEIKLRMPRLTHLDLKFTFSVCEIENDLCRLLEGLPKLQKLTMPRFTLTNKVIETLSLLPDLGTIQFEYIDQGCGDSADLAKWNPALQEGAFPALYDFTISAEISQMLRFVQGPFFPGSSLKSFYFHILTTTAPALLHDFLAAVADACPALAELYLDFVGTPHPIVYRRDPPHGDLVTWATLRPVLKCPKLTTFHFRWDTPLLISHADVAELAAAWPALEVLVLNNEAPPTARPSSNSSSSSSSSSTLTLDALLPFARHCPRLRELGLCLAAETASRAVPALPPFRALRTLGLGLSRIPPAQTDSEAAALFLSQLCPPGCAVTAGVEWPEFFGAAEAATEEDAAALAGVLRETAAWCERWAEVGRVLPLLTRLRMEERARREELEREVVDLRTRCRVLEERLGMGAGAMADKGCVLL